MLNFANLNTRHFKINGGKNVKQKRVEKRVNVPTLQLKNKRDLKSKNHNISNSLIFAKKQIKNIVTEKPFFNILIRNCYRPKSFEKCISTIGNQNYDKSHIRVICCYDDDRCLDYLNKYKKHLNMDIFKVSINSTEKYKFNLYCNYLLDSVKDGWVLFLDDDDMFSNKNSLNVISKNLKSHNDLIFWKVNIASKLVYPKNLDNIKKGQISTIGFCFNISKRLNSKWIDKPGGDYNFVTELTKKCKFNKIFINNILTKTVYNQYGLRGIREECYEFSNFLKEQNIEQCYVSSSLSHLKPRYMTNYGLKEYKDITKPCVYFGMYTKEDIYAFSTNICGSNYVMLGGSDFPNVKKILPRKPIFLSISDDLQQRINSIGVFNVRVNINLVDKNIFKKVNTEELGNKVFIYDGLVRKKENENTYGKKFYDEVVKRLSPKFKFIFSSQLNKKYEEMPNIYKQCFIGLRLTGQDGNANMVQEMEEMGIPVIHNQSNYGIKWKNENDICNIILKNENDICNIILKNEPCHNLLLNDESYSNSLDLDNCIIEKINKNIDNMVRFLKYKKYKKILFICSDYPGYGGAATNCSNLADFFNKDFITYSVYWNYQNETNKKYEETESYKIVDQKDLNATLLTLNFKPDVVILKNAFCLNIRDYFDCNIVFFVPGIYKNNLDQYYQLLNTKKEHDKYINTAVLNQIRSSDYSFCNSLHTKKILENIYKLNTGIFYSSFISFYNKKIEYDENFKNRKYDYGLIVSDFNRKIKNVETSINFLKDKKNVILIGKGSKKYTNLGFECVELVSKNSMVDYYKQIKYIVQDSYFESCSNVKIEALFSGCKITKKSIVVSSTQYPGYGGAATNAYKIIKYLRSKGYKTFGLFFHTETTVNYDPDNIGGILIVNNNTNYNNIIKSCVSYLGSYPNVCLAKNTLAPVLCKKIFNVQTIYLVSGINHQPLFYKNLSYHEILKLDSIEYYSKEETCLENVDKVLFNGKQTLDFFNKFYKKYNQKFINEIIDTSFVHEVLSTDNVEKKYDIVICCTNLKRVDKNNLFLVKVLMNTRLNNYKKLIIGKGNEYFKLIPNSTFISELKNSEVIDIFKKSRLLLYPSLIDTNPNTVREAVNSNCSVLISKNCGYSEVYPKRFVCETYNIDEWILKIFDLLDNNYKCTPDIYKKYCNNIEKFFEY
jgi:hypothetical protein